MSTTAVESPLGINQYSLSSVEEVPNGNEEVDDITEAMHVIKPTTRSDGSRTRRRHPNTNSKVGTQTQKDQHESRDKGGSKSKGQDPENQRNRDDYVAIMGDSQGWYGSWKPGKSWNFNIPKSWPGNPGKSILVMERHEKLKFYITLTKYFTYFNLPVITII